MENEDDVIYEGKAKYLLEREDDPDRLVQRFKDDATAFNGEKFAQFDGKGKLNCAISSHLFDKLDDQGIHTHFLGRISDTDMLVERLEIVPVEVVVRNLVGGSLKGRTGYERGRPVNPPIVEWFYKSDELDDPMLADEHIRYMELCDSETLALMETKAREVNDALVDIFAEEGLLLADIKFEFGFDAVGDIVLGDEISPDVARIWNEDDHRRLDKDVFRKDIGDLIETYEEVADRLGVDVDLVE